MNQVHTLITAAALVLAASVHAHDCSGGKDGGMDATGNECNQPVPIVAAAQAPAKSVAQRPTTAAARPATASTRPPKRSDRMVLVATPQRR
jgi:hypothetical protein